MYDLDYCVNDRGQSMHMRSMFYLLMYDSAGMAVGFLHVFIFV